MTDTAPASADLLDLLLERVESSGLSAVAQLLVLAAYKGQDELDQALEGGGRSATDEQVVARPRSRLACHGIPS